MAAPELPAAPVLDDPRLVERVARLRLVARTVVESVLQGRHRSAYKGFSLEFAQHREYSRGDELRHLDWKVFARSDRLFVKQFEEETNLRALLCLDASGSMRFGGPGRESKSDCSRRLAAALAYLLLAQSDAVGLAVCDSDLRAFVPARSARSHWPNLLRVLAQAEPRGATRLPQVLHDLASRMGRRGLLLVVSDLFFSPAELAEALAHLHHQRHEVILFQVLDPLEEEFPFRETMEFRSMEHPAQRVKLDAARARGLYLERFAAFRRDLGAACHRFKYDLCELRTGAPLDAALAHFLRRRQEH